MRFDLDGTCNPECNLTLPLTTVLSGLEVFFPYDFIYKEQLNFMLELKVSAKQSPLNP